MKKIVISLSLLLALLCCVGVAGANVELALKGKKAQLISEVYQYDGVVYLAIDDVLPALGLRGYWDSVAHCYKIRTPMGRATFFPGGRYLRIGDRFLPIRHPCRFIDGKLRVSQDFVEETLSRLVVGSIYFRNLDPARAIAVANDNSDDIYGAYSFLVRSDRERRSTRLRAVAIDPAHGGDDSGTVGIDNLKEKTVVLAVARKLEKRLKMRLGIPVYLSRNDDYSLDLRQHLACADHDDVDALVQLHAQASLSGDVHGVHLYVRSSSGTLSGRGRTDPSLILALSVSEALRDAGFDVVEVAPAHLVTTGKGNLPTVVIEMGYLTNSDDAAVLGSDNGQQRMANAIFSGLEAFAKASRKTGETN